MYKTILFLFFLLPIFVFSQKDTIELSSEISDVTVFFTGAQVSRKAKLNLQKGEYLLKFQKLPQEINPQSIQIKGIENCKILSVKHQKSYSTMSERNASVNVKEDLVKAQENKIKSLKNKLRVFEQEEDLLLKNSDLGSENSAASIAAIREAADFYRNRLNTINEEKLRLSIELEGAREKLQKLYKKLNEAIAQESMLYSEILLRIACETAVNSELELTYYIPSAGWVPYYDFRLDEITEPLSIVYNAEVFQTSGEDWKNVHLVLSTTNPSLSGTIPELEIWYLGRNNSVGRQNYTEGVSSIQGRVMDAETNEALPFANVSLKQDNKLIAGASTDFDGQYLIKPVPPGYYDLQVDYVGYQSVKMEDVLLQSNKITFQEIHLNQGVVLEEVEVVEYSLPLLEKDNNSSGATINQEEFQRLPIRSKSNKAINVRGSRASGEELYIDGKGKRESTNYIANSLKTKATSINYEIEIPYSIPSDGKNYSISIKENKLPVDYIYYAVPKLDEDVFLTAKIADWADLNLLSGNSNIFFQGTYTGKAYIDVEKTGDTLSLPLGRDQGIVIKRELNKELNDKRFLGTNVKETVAWDINVRNNKNVPVEIVVEDQYPISERESIEVERLENSNAKVEENTGKLSWRIELQPNENKLLQYKYSVKYPVDLNLETQ